MIYEFVDGVGKQTKQVQFIENTSFIWLYN
jgi:hypothetical protein